MTSFNSIFRYIYFILIGKIKFSTQYIDKWICMEDLIEFKVFRHMKLINRNNTAMGSIFIVRFKFKSLTHEANKKVSKIPIPLIGGFKGFRDKIWMIDENTGYWQGIYQFDSMNSIERYKKSFVLGIMNKRAIDSSLVYWVVPNMSIDHYLQEKIVVRV